jgi:hypothetical protein
MCASRPSPIKPWWWDGIVKAEIHRGRWIALCPQCEAGVGVHPEWPVAYCGSCGAALRVVVPAAWRSIEKLLVNRPTKHQGWLVGETLEDLRRENREHGVRAPRKVAA